MSNKAFHLRKLSFLSEKMILHFAIIAFLSPVIMGLGQPEDCFLPGECLSSIHIDGDEVKNKEECLQLCKNTDGKCKIEFTVVHVHNLFS